MLSTVAALLVPDVAPFEFGVLAEVFGIDRSEEGVPPIEFRVCGPEAGVPLRLLGRRASSMPEHGLDGLRGADLVAVARHPPSRVPARGPRRAARRRGSRRAPCSASAPGSSCWARPACSTAGACTTHWMNVDELRARYPLARVDPDVLFVDDGNLITSAGTAAGHRRLPAPGAP